MHNLNLNYSSYLSSPGTLKSVELLDKDTLYGGTWTSSMILTFTFGLTGIVLSPNFSMLTFSSKEVAPFASQQVWFSGLLIGFLLIFFTLAIGVGSVFLGANDIINEILKTKLED